MYIEYTIIKKNILRQAQYDNESTKLCQYKIYNLISNSEAI
jgi:hypothetical protein